MNREIKSTMAWVLGAVLVMSAAAAAGAERDCVPDRVAPQLMVDGYAAGTAREFLAELAWHHRRTVQSAGVGLLSRAYPAGSDEYPAEERVWRIAGAAAPNRTY
ncbi:hypothetical protein EV699_11213 [Plasticicumulans lactativorans]|uniref:Uncharacterized protein n=1 Tax=Plasticicumulans lactativorans TaxID=1133106 RepID=A0A4R2LCV3_9GAMM|nr:hypothetical protein [Plasticicumulans lactativorans]TCO80678.1 hypothetical protein EV699_11213 [Plasticicumulans lactativorans]